MKSILPLLFVALVFAACDGAPHPLSAPNVVPVDSSMTGTWRIVADDDAGTERFSIWPFNAFEYYAEYGSTDLNDRSDSDLERLRVFFTPIGNAQYANIQCLDCDDLSWLFLRVERTSTNEVLLTPVDDEVYKTFKESPDAASVAQRLSDALPAALDLDNAARFKRLSPIPDDPRRRK